MKGYSLGGLLKNQPVELKKNSDFKYLINLYNHSDCLKKTRFRRKCYSLLLKARISSENLDRFYLFYRLPKHSFFPLFLKLRKEYLDKIDWKKKEKNDYILKKMRQLPDNIQIFIKCLANHEKSLSGKSCAVWLDFFYPKTKKKVNSYFKFNFFDWLKSSEKYTDLLAGRFKKIDINHIKRITSIFILGLSEDNYSIEMIKKSYRILSKKYHPDQGGDPDFFKKVKDAYDFLTKDIHYMKQL